MKSNFFKYTFFIIVFILIILAIYILYKDGNSKTLAKEENKMRINMITDLNIGVTGFDTLNPILSNNIDTQYISKLIFDPLLDITKDFRIENCLTKEVSKLNSKTYLIKLKDDIYFHDGSKFTAQDVIFTIESLKNNNINSIYKENVKDIESMQKIDDYTLKISLNKEIEFFEYRLCIPILCKNSYDENTLESKTNLPNGTGKYKVESVDDKVIKLAISERNTSSNIKEINVYIASSIKDLYDDFIKEKTDYIITSNIEYEKYLGVFGYNVIQVTGRKFDYLVLNNNNRFLSDKDVRKAINYAIDRNSINYNIYNNKYYISNFPLEYGSYLYDSNQTDSFNTNKAKAILIDSGWRSYNNSWIKNGKVLRLNLITNRENDDRSRISKMIKEQLEEIGIKIDIMEVDKYSYDRYLKNKSYDMLLTGNIVPSYPSLNTYFGDDNLSNYNNEYIGEILTDIENIDNKEVLKEKYLKIIDIYNEEIPFISLYFDNMFIISNKNLKGDLSCNWFNLFYNIDNWYKVK